MICKNIFIGMKLKIKERNMSQAMCVSAIPFSKKMHCPIWIPRSGRLYFFIDQDEQSCPLIVLATDISKDVLLKEQT